MQSSVQQIPMIAQDLPSEGMALPPVPMLAHLRLAALTCRAASRLDVAKACMMLSIEPCRAAETYLTTLIRALDRAMGARLKILRPGTAEPSFDERWLTRLIERAEADDIDSVYFLLARRVPKHAIRSIAFLVRGLAARARDLSAA